jgi:DNA ligase-1
MHPVEILQRLSNTKSRKDKEQIILDAFLAGSREFFRGVRLALDPLITFNVAKVAQIMEEDDDPGSYSFDDFIELAKRLHSRELTGHAARDAIHAAANRCHVATWNGFYRRILLKDLRAGVDEKTFNKVMRSLLPGYPEAEQYLIPVFACQLAHDGEAPAHQKKVRGRKLIDVKLDGVRVVAALDRDNAAITLFSRNGLVLDNFPELHTALQSLLPRLPGSVILDGELVSPLGFQHLMTLVRRKDYHPDMTSVRYALFDIVPLDDFRVGHCDKPQHERHRMLEALQEAGLWAQTAGRVYVIPQIAVDLDTPEGQAAFDEFNRRAIAEQYEGIMIKDPDAPYTGKRTSAWLKRKPVIEVTLMVVGFEPGDADSKYAETLGALVCQGTDAGLPIASNVAGGISDELRDEIWHHQDDYRGMMVDVRADRLTLEEGSAVHALRFPRLKGFRGRVPAEKL